MTQITKKILEEILEKKLDEKLRPIVQTVNELYKGQFSTSGLTQIRINFKTKSVIFQIILRPMESIIF
jgi:hypothetical protein